MPLIQVTMIEGRTAEQKEALLAAITQAVEDTIDAPRESIRVWITDVPSKQFMSAGVLAADRRQDEQAPPAGAPLTDLAETGTEPGVPPAPPVDPIGAPGGSGPPL